MIAVNYVDMVLGAILLAAFVRGFMAGLWKALFNLGSTVVSLIAAYFLTGPTVNALDRNYHILNNMASWWQNVFKSVPGLSVPYDPRTTALALEIAGSGRWSDLVKGALVANLPAVAEAAGANPTWGQVVSLGLARLVLSAVASLVILAVARMMCNLFAGALSKGGPTSTSARFLGALVEAALAAVWLSVAAGVVYPLVSPGLLGQFGQVASESVVLTGLLSIYGALWPFMLAKIR